jgi:hypothetical protein
MPLAVFVVLFLFSFGFCLYFYVSYSDLRAKIYGNSTSQERTNFGQLDTEDGTYVGYIAKLAGQR